LRARTFLAASLTAGPAAFLVTHALVKNLPNQTTEPVRDHADRLRMTEARDKPAIDERENDALGLHRGVGVKGATNRSGCSVCGLAPEPNLESA
jgi:hypothetical protein